MSHKCVDAFVGVCRDVVDINID